MNTLSKKIEYEEDRNPVKDLNPENKSNLNKNELTKISKKLSWVLRHGAIRENIPITKNGFVSLEIISKYLNVSNKDIACIVSDDDKERYKMVYKKNSYDIYIRANQGHSMKDICVEMKLITDHEQVPIAVHGTFYKFLDLILNSGLKIMGRQHVHFAKGLPDNEEVISGIRNNSEVLIYLNVKKMIDDKIEIYESDNGVILSSGQNGVILPKYFEMIIDTKTKKKIFPVE
jgi:RNA:NAD 2'-phosphotransferase (TPT1/KptA family)